MGIQERPRRSVEENAIRMSESLEIAQQGPLFAAGVGAVALLTGNSVDSCLQNQQRALETFANASRRNKLGMIIRFQTTCARTAECLNPGCKETPFATQVRRLDLVQRFVQAGLVEGPLAGQVTDLVMGRFRFSVEDGELFREWNIERDILSGKGGS